MMAAGMCLGGDEAVFSLVKHVAMGPTMAAAVEEGKLFVIGGGKLSVFDVSDPANPARLGQISGLGTTRQLVVRDGIAYLTSREDGVFIVDCRKPDKPRLFAHYDSIEVATGIALAGDVLFVACRHYGVELVDVSDPGQPRHLSTVRTGESQSVCVRDGIAYVGVWGSSELAVVDARDARNPRLVEKLPLDGYGDGVWLHGDKLLAATGHHSREKNVWHPKSGDAGYGEGHGLEIYSVADPLKPQLLSRCKTPPFYKLGNDMWGVRTHGTTAFLADTHNGAFMIDLSDPTEPRIQARFPLPAHGAKGELDYVGGLAVGDQVVYVCGGHTGLYILHTPGTEVLASDTGTPSAISVSRTPSLPKGIQAFRCDGQVRGVATVGDCAVVAAGHDGIHTVMLNGALAELAHYPVEGFAMAVASHKDLVFVAEEKAGLSIRRHLGGGKLELVSRYKPKGKIVRDVVLAGDGRFAFVQVGLSLLDILDLSDPAAPQRTMRDRGHGFLYHMDTDGLESDGLCILWQLDGLHWYRIADGTVTKSSRRYPHRIGNGGSMLLGGNRTVVFRGGLVTIAEGEMRPPQELEPTRIPDVRLKGCPVVVDELLVVTDRAEGNIWKIDVSDPATPRLISSYSTDGNPGRAVPWKDRLLVPNGYEGLWVAPR